MRSCRNNRTIFAWVAMFAFLIGAMASAAMPLAPGAGGDSWVEVCTLSGSKWVNADGASADAHVPGQNLSAVHCPWCSLHTPALGLPAQAQVSLVPCLPEPKIGRRDAAATRQARAWALAPSRAPPLAS